MKIEQVPALEIGFNFIMIISASSQAVKFILILPACSQILKFIMILFVCC